MRRLSVLLLLALTIACNKEVTDPPPPETNTVIASTNRQFLPPSAPIRRGGAVTWEAQTLAHQVLFEVKAGAPDDIVNLGAGTSESRVFNTAGQYDYRCDLHPGMIGIITVIEP